MTTTAFKKGDRVSFLAGPRSTARTIARVTGEEPATSGLGSYLITEDDAGKVRKVRPGACTSA